MAAERKEKERICVYVFVLIYLSLFCVACGIGKRVPGSRFFGLCMFGVVTLLCDGVRVSEAVGVR